MTIYDIAEMANVSIATVSRVLNNKPNVKKEKVDRIIRIMNEIGYVPNNNARALNKKRTNLIGIVINDIRNIYRATVVYYLERLLSEHGYSVIVFNANEKSTSIVSILRKQEMDAVIFVGSSMSCNWVKEFIVQHFNNKPVLLFNGNLDIKNVISVVCDEYRGMQLVVEHLYRTGRRKFVYVNYSNSPASQRKLNGYREKLLEFGIPIDESRIINTDDEGFYGGCDAAKKIIDFGMKFDAVVCGLDLLALGIIHTMKKFGLKILVDYAITGFDNLIFGKLSEPFLTSVDGQIELMSSISIDMLVTALNGKKNLASVTYIPPSLFLGGTT